MLHPAHDNGGSHDAKDGREGRGSQLAQDWVLPHPTLYLRRSVFDRNGLYDTNFRVVADFEVMLGLPVRGKIRIGYLSKVMVSIHGRGGSMLRKSNEDCRVLRSYGVGGIGTLLSKNFGKLGQYIKKDI